jgi:hypothetical protein
MSRIGIWFQNLSRFGQFGVVSLALHAALVLTLLINHAATARPPLRRPIQVRMSLPSSPAVAANSKKAPLAPVKEMKKATASKAAPPKKNKAAKESPQEAGLDQKLLRQIADSLDAIGKEAKTAKPLSFAPRLPPSIAIESGGKAAAIRPGYGETVSGILQNSLDLPEFGQVVAKIEIDAAGSVTQCEILEAKSRKNGEFLKKRLRELVFPCFNEFGIAENHLNFTITFHNAENR